MFYYVEYNEIQEKVTHDCLTGKFFPPFLIIYKHMILYRCPRDFDAAGQL